MKEYHKIKKDKPAFAIIFNNENFEKGKNRTGTQIDKKSILSLEEHLKGNIVFHHTLEDLKSDEFIGAFKMLGKCDAKSLNDQEVEGAMKLFHPPEDYLSCKGLSIEEKRSLLEKPQITFDFSKYSCFMAFILSHGTEEGISGTDDIKSKPVSIHVLSSYITPKKCKGLKDKPKIFFLQACRGSNRSVVVQGDDDDDGRDSNEEDDDEDADGITLFSYVCSCIYWV